MGTSHNIATLLLDIPLNILTASNCFEFMNKVVIKDCCLIITFGKSQNAVLTKELFKRF